MRIVEAFKAGFHAVRRSRRLIALVAVVDALIALPPAIYVASVVDQAASRRLDADHLALHLDPDFWADLARNDAPGFSGIVTALVLGSLLAFFVTRPLIMGGYVGAAASDKRPRFDDFIREGGALYWKFLRLAVVSLLVMFALSLAAAPLLDSIEEQARRHQREDILLNWRRITELVVFGVFLATSTIVDYARVGIHRYRRPGVIAELLRSTLFVLQSPVRTLGLALVLFLMEVGSLAIAVPVFRWADGGYLLTAVVMFILLQVQIMVREGLRMWHIASAYHTRVADEPSEQPRTDGDVPEEDGDLLSNLPWNTE